MSKTGRENVRRPAKGRNRPNRPERRITVRGVRRQPFDPRPLGRAAIAQALAEAEAQRAADNAAAQHKPIGETGNGQEGGAHESE